jgi:hypothetical protein
MQERREFSVVATVGVVRDEGVGLEHGFESLAGVTGLVSHFSEVLEVAGDLMFVPGEQDRFNV